MPYCAFPVTLSGVSRRLAGVPISLKGFRIFERYLARHRQPGSLLSQGPVAELAACRRVNDRAPFGTTGVLIHTPGLCRRRHEHDSSGGPGPAQWLPERAHRGRTPCYLNPCEYRIRIELVVRRCRFEVDLVDPHLQLLGDEHRHGGVGALPHLDLRHAQGDAAVAIHSDEAVGREAFCADCVSSFGIARERGQREAQQQTTTKRTCSSQKLAAGGVTVRNRAGICYVAQPSERHDRTPFRRRIWTAPNV